jgi:hypothetical protein
MGELVVGLYYFGYVAVALDVLSVWRGVKEEA